MSLDAQQQAQYQILKALFEQHQWATNEVLHPPLETALQADEYGLVRNGQRLKNLFLRDNYGKRHFLLITAHDAKVDLKALSKTQGVSRLGFASNARLAKYLKVKPGCVSMLALLFDEGKDVTLWCDDAIYGAASYLCHPGHNQASWQVSDADLRAFLAITGHPMTVLPVPKVAD